MKARLVVSRPTCACGSPDCRLPKFNAILERARRKASPFRASAPRRSPQALTAA